MIVLKEILVSLDKTVFFFFQHLQSPGWDCALAWPTHLGGTFILLSVLFVLILMFDRKKGLLKFSVVTAGLLTVGWINPWLKTIFRRPRPFLVWDNVHVLFYKPWDYAFPSGHTATAFAAAFLLDYLYPGKMRWTYAVAAWIGLTRIYVGVHFLTDVLCGAFVGIGSAALCCWILRCFNIYTPAKRNDSGFCNPKGPTPCAGQN